jgi:N utilization substance protein B
MAGRRRTARVIALQSLFELDIVGHEPADCVSRIAKEASAAKEITAYALELVNGVIENQKRINEIIEETAPAWPLNQIAATDRNILRLAIYEIVIDNKVPMRAAINEAVELAKEYGGDNSPRFVNGVLGSVSALVTADRG